MFFLPICHCGSAYSKLILLCMRSSASFWTVSEQCTPRHRSRRLLRVESSPWNLTSTSISSGSGSFYRVIVSFLATVARFCAVQICFGFVRICVELIWTQSYIYGKLAVFWSPIIDIFDCVIADALFFRQAYIFTFTPSKCRYTSQNHAQRVRLGNLKHFEKKSSKNID